MWLCFLLLLGVGFSIEREPIPPLSSAPPPLAPSPSPIYYPSPPPDANSVYIGGAYRQNITESSYTTLSGVTLQGKWSNTGAPSFAAGWVMSIASNDNYIVLGGAINALLDSSGERQDEFQSGILLCNVTSTADDAFVCNSLLSTKTGPSSSYTKSLVFSGSCLATASPQVPTQIDSTSAFLYDTKEEQWEAIAIPCDLSFCDASSVWGLTKAVPPYSSQFPNRGSDERGGTSDGNESKDSCSLDKLMWSVVDVTGQELLYVYSSSTIGSWQPFYSTSQTKVSSITWVVQIPNGDIVISGEIYLIDGIQLCNIAVWRYATHLWEPLTDDGCVFKEPPVRLQYLSSDFFSSPVLAISGQFSGMCENDEMTTLVFWDLEGNLAPVCGNVSDEQGGNQNVSHLARKYVREKLSTTEKITDHYLTDSGIIYSAVDQIDLLDPAPPFIQFFDPSAKDPEWQTLLSTLSKQQSSCRLCSISFPDSQKVHQLTHLNNSALTVLNLADYPRNASVALELLAPIAANDTDNAKEFLGVVDWEVGREGEGKGKRGGVLEVYAMYYAQVAAVTEVEGSLFMGGSFGSRTNNFTNLIYQDDDGDWIGLGAERGIDNGLVNSLVYVEQTNMLAIGGLFTIVQNRSNMEADSCPEDQDTEHSEQCVFYSLALYNMDEQTSDGWFYPVKGFYGQDYITGEVGVLENVGSYLFVGGSFKIRATVQEGPPVYIENFGIWDLEKQEWLLDAGLGIGKYQNFSSQTTSDYQTRFQVSLSTVKAFLVTNGGKELIIGGQFETELGSHSYSSLARLNLLTWEWLPILGVIGIDGSAGAVLTVEYGNFTKVGKSLLFIGGRFTSSVGGHILYNSAKCQVDVNDEDGLLMGGCLDEETVEGWDGMGNGLDGWVGDMGVLPEEGEVLVVGGFHKTVLETPLQTLCPVFMYRVPEDEFINFGDCTICSGFYLTATPYFSREPLWIEDHLKLVIGVSVATIVIFVLLVIGIFIYRHQQKRIEQKYGFQEVNRLLINNMEDDDSSIGEREIQDFSAYGSISGYLSDRDSSYSNVRYSTSKEKEPARSPFKINFIGIVEADLMGENERNKEGTLRLYAIRVATGLHAWEVQRSPRDFEILYESLSEKFDRVTLPVLPKVKQDDISDLMKSRAKYQAFLRKTVEIFFKEGINKKIGVEGGEQPLGGAESGGVELISMDSVLQDFLFRGRVEEKGQLDASWEVNVEHVKLYKRVGLGSFAEVFHGEWKGVTVAVKVLLPPMMWASETSLMSSFSAEVGLMTKLHHPNILTFYGACTKPPNLLMLTEWMGRGDLFEIIGDPHSPFQRFCLYTRLKMAEQCTVGLCYLHSLVPPVVHRDMKSMNLLVDDKWNVKIADFGMSKVKALYLSDQNKSRVGTAAWSAPEVLRAESYSEKADVYSLGIIIWEVVTKQHPHSEHSYFSIVNKGEAGTLQLDLKDIDENIRKLIEWCVEVQPEERPTAEEVYESLGKILGTLPPPKIDERKAAAQEEKAAMKEEKKAEIEIELELEERKAEMRQYKTVGSTLQ